MSGVSVLVPTVNEAGNVDELLDRIHAAIECEIIVIDGESTDGTQEKVRARGDAKLVVQTGNQGGLSGAILQGAAAASHENVVVIDADLSHPPEVIPQLVERLGDHDMVVGSRKVDGGGAPGWPATRRFTSWVASSLAWPLVDVRDPMAGFFATRRELLLEVDPAAGGFKIGLEVLLLRDGTLRTDEVPIVFNDRTHGESKLGSKVIRAYLERLIALAGGRALPAYAALGALVDFGVMLAAGPIAGGAVAWTMVYLLSRRHRLDDGMTEGRRAFRAITVGFMALFLRDGIHALGGGAATTAVVGAVLIHLGNVFYVFPRPQPPGAYRTRWRVAAAAIVVYSVLLRLVYAGAVDLIPEEAYYWNYAQHPAPGYLDHPPMVAWLIGLGTALFGDNAFGVRILALVCWGVGALFSYRLTRDLYSKGHGLLALALFASLPFFLGGSFVMTPDAPLIACWSAAIFYLARVFIRGDARAWWGAGLAIGLGMLSKYSIVFLGPPIVVLMLFDRQWWRRVEPYGAGLLALLVFSPVLWWNYQHDWASFAFQGARRVKMVAEFSLDTQLLAALVMLTPLGVRALWVGLRRSEYRRFLATVILVPFAIVVLFSLRKWTKPNWTGPIWIAAVPVLATSVWLSAVWSRRWGATLSVVLCILGGLLQYFSLGMPGAWYPDRLRTPVGWREMSAEVSQLEREFKNPPVVVGMDRYFVASQLAFHNPNREVTGRHVVGHPSLMWEYWSDPARFAGRDMLLVGLEEYDLDELGSRFAEVGPIREVRLGIKGRFFFRVARGYRPPR